MRWFKHLTAAADDEKIAELIDRHGAEGYGIYWMILEKIAFLMDGSNKTFARYSIKKWSKFCGKSPKVFRNFLETFEKLSLFYSEISGKDSDFLIIDCPNLLKYRDEYSKKSRQTPDKLQTVSVATPDQDRDRDRDRDRDIKKKKKKKLFVEDSDEFRLAVYLEKHILRNNPDFKKKNLQSWAKQFDLLLRVDKRKIKEVRKLIEWCQTDSFWMTNILSASKFKKQYDQLKIKFNTPKPKEDNGRAKALKEIEETKKLINGEL